MLWASCNFIILSEIKAFPIAIFIAVTKKSTFYFNLCSQQLRHWGCHAGKWWRRKHVGIAWICSFVLISRKRSLYFQTGPCSGEQSSEAKNTGLAPEVSIRRKVQRLQTFIRLGTGRWCAADFGAFITTALIWGADLFCTGYVAISSIACSCSHQDCFSCWQWSRQKQWSERNNRNSPAGKEKGLSEDIITFAGCGLLLATGLLPPHGQQIKGWNANVLGYWEK